VTKLDATNEVGKEGHSLP